MVTGMVTDVTNSNQVSSRDPLGTKILPAFYLLFELRTNLAKGSCKEDGPRAYCALRAYLVPDNTCTHVLYVSAIQQDERLAKDVLKLMLVG